MTRGVLAALTQKSNISGFCRPTLRGKEYRPGGKPPGYTQPSKTIRFQKNIFYEAKKKFQY